MAIYFGRTWVVTAAVTLFCAVGCRSAAKKPEAEVKPIPLPEHVAGANLRPVGDLRRGYGTKRARETMARLEGMGVNTIAVLMEGRMTNLQDTQIRLPDRTALEAIRAALLDANRMKLATVLIPHIYLDDGRWRGDIAFTDPKARDEWWASYRRFILEAAAISGATGTSVLSIGVELKAMSAEIDTRTRMRHLKSAVRKQFDGPTTYSANWDEAERVAFWDVVELAGVNAYYPLVPDPARGAETVGRRLSALSDRAQRDVLIIEVGYRSSPLSHIRPWEWPEDIGAAVDNAAQAQNWAAVLTHWLPARGVRGILLWVIPTDPDDPASEPAHGFSPMNKPAEEVIRRAFKKYTKEAG